MTFWEGNYTPGFTQWDTVWETIWLVMLIRVIRKEKRKERRSEERTSQQRLEEERNAKESKGKEEKRMSDLFSHVNDNSQRFMFIVLLMQVCFFGYLKYWVFLCVVKQPFPEDGLFFTLLLQETSNSWVLIDHHFGETSQNCYSLGLAMHT
jgi:uncharacterized membrane protein